MLEGQSVLKITVHFHLIYESNPLERQPVRAAFNKENFYRQIRFSQIAVFWKS
jgi:hypothetical protein